MPFRHSLGIAKTGEVNTGVDYDEGKLDNNDDGPERASLDRVEAQVPPELTTRPSPDAISTIWVPVVWHCHRMSLSCTKVADGHVLESGGTGGCD